VPEDEDFSAFRAIYTEACRLGLEGCATVRLNPVTGADLKEECAPHSSTQFCGLDRESD